MSIIVRPTISRGRANGGVGEDAYRETRNYVRKIQRFLGAAAAATAPPSDSATFFVPSARLTQVRSAQARAKRPARPRRIDPARPAIYYRWRDQQGITHVAEKPPSEGTVYTMIRALD